MKKYIKGNGGVIKSQKQEIKRLMQMDENKSIEIKSDIGLCDNQQIEPEDIEPYIHLTAEQ